MGILTIGEKRGKKMDDLYESRVRYLNKIYFCCRHIMLCNYFCHHGVLKFVYLPRS